MSRRTRFSPRSSEEKSKDGFGVIEVVVSIFLLGLLGVLIAGGLVQNILANAQNVLIASASQVVTEEVLRIQNSVSDCTALSGAIAGTSQATELVLGETKIIEVRTEKLGWATCGQITSGIYPIRLVASSDSEDLFSVDTLLILK